MNRIINGLIHYKTVYIFANAKLFAWMMGIFLFGMKNAATGIQRPLHEQPVIAAFVLVISVVGLLNLLWNKVWLYRVMSVIFATFWTFALFDFGPTSLSFARVIPETVLIYILAWHVFAAELVVDSPRKVNTMEP